jgi:hypothetical protein
VPAVTIGVDVFRRLGTVCSWVGYNTTVNVRNVSLTLNTFENIVVEDRGTISKMTPITKTFSDFTPPGEVSGVLYLSHFKIGDAVRNENIDQFDFGFIKIHAEASSRGTNNNWAVIDCGN